MASYYGQFTGIHEEMGTGKASTPRQRRKSYEAQTGDEELSVRYRRGEVIGRGANGMVYQGLDRFSGKLVAIKEVPARRNDQNFSKLMSEVQLMAKLQHRHIVGYHGAELDEQAGVLLIYQEWVPGGSIDTLLERFSDEKRGFPEELVARYAVHVAKGLAYLHENRIVHRDIKGGNVLVNDLGVAKLSDFGTSMMMADTTQASGFTAMCGTPYFMAPEIMRGCTYGRKADIWSYGGLLLQMGTGQPPWKSLNFNSIPQLMLHVVKVAQPPPLDDQLSQALTSLVLRCFHYDPKDRPLAHDLLDDPFLIDFAQLHEDSADNESEERSTPRGSCTPLAKNTNDTFYEAASQIPAIIPSISPSRPRAVGTNNPFGRSAAAKSRSRSITTQSLNAAKIDDDIHTRPRWATASADRPMTSSKTSPRRSRPKPLGLPPRDAASAYGQNAKSPLSTRSSTSSLPTPSEAAAFDSFATSITDDPIMNDETVEEEEEDEDDEDNIHDSASENESQATIPVPSCQPKDNPSTSLSPTTTDNFKEADYRRHVHLEEADEDQEDSEDNVITIEEALEKGFIDCNEYHRRLEQSTNDPDLTFYRAIPKNNGPC